MSVNSTGDALGAPSNRPERPILAQLIIKLQEGPPVWTIGGTIYRDKEPLTIFANHVNEDQVLMQSFPRLARRLSRRRLRDAESEGATGRDAPPAPSIDTYLRMRFFTKHPEELADLMAELEESEEVERVVLAGRPHRASLPGDLSGDQGYLLAGPAGVGARHAWRVVGGNGSGVTVGLVDTAYCGDHIDLPPVEALRTASAPSDSSLAHGTQSLGVLGAPRDEYGMAGICHGASFCFASWLDLLEDELLPEDEELTGEELRIRKLVRNIDAAIDRLIETDEPPASDVPGAPLFLPRGSVLLLECDLEAPDTVYGTDCSFVPVEVAEDIRASLVEAAAMGITVIEPAGNGNGELGVVTSPGGTVVWDPAVHESGAIIVGASHPSDHSHIFGTNWGDRVDCHAWGENVGAPTCNPASEDEYPYVTGFANTSAASAIVGGVVACLQGARMAHYDGVPLPPDKIREWLRTTGTPQTGEKHIGPQPDLHVLLCKIGLCPDLVVRDHVMDHGSVPVADLQFRCPDIYIKRDPPLPDPEVMFAGPRWWQEVFPQPVLGPDPIWIYSRTRNLGHAPCPAELRVWWADPSAWVHPFFWKPASSALPVTLPAGGGGVIQISGAIPWDGPRPSWPQPSLIVAVSPEGAPTPFPGADASTASFLRFLRTNANLRIRNVQTASTSGGARGGAVYRFHFRGVAEGPADFDLQIVPSLPPGSTVRITVDRPLFHRAPSGVVEPYPPLPDETAEVEGELAGPPLLLPRLHLDALDEVVFTAQVTVAPETPGGVWRSYVDQFLGGERIGRAWFDLTVKEIPS